LEESILLEKEVAAFDAGQDLGRKHREPLVDPTGIDIGLARPLRTPLAAGHGAAARRSSGRRWSPAMSRAGPRSGSGAPVAGRVGQVGVIVSQEYSLIIYPLVSKPFSPTEMDIKDVPKYRPPADCHYWRRPQLGFIREASV
jgi:hypothetical protein